MLVIDDIDVTGIVLNNEDVFSQKNMIRSRNRVRHVRSQINSEWLKRDRVKQLLNLFSHWLESGAVE